jgi:hypothetical protein
MLDGISYVILLYNSNAREFRAISHRSVTIFYTYLSNRNIYTNIYGDDLELRSPRTVNVRITMLVKDQVQHKVPAVSNVAAGQRNRPAHCRSNRRSLVNQIRENQPLYRI